MYVLKIILTFHNLHRVYTGTMNKIIGKWSKSVNDEDKRFGMQVTSRVVYKKGQFKWMGVWQGDLWYYYFFLSYNQHVFMYIILLN